MVQHLIENNFLRLEPITQDNVTESYLRWLNDDVTTEFLEVRFNKPKTLELLRLEVEAICSDSTVILLGIFKKPDNAHIGNIKLGPINKIHGYAEIGFLIGEENERGKGFATMAIDLVTNYAFECLDIKKIIAGCYEGNHPSYYALLKAGFVKEGSQALKYDVNGTRKDGLILGKTKPGVA
jgi:RimJ/RimL family protein N-acetyltransferase